MPLVGLEASATAGSLVASTAGAPNVLFTKARSSLGVMAGGSASQRAQHSLGGTKSGESTKSFESWKMPAVCTASRMGRPQGSERHTPPQDVVDGALRFEKDCLAETV
jgi:hypothetical protein